MRDWTTSDGATFAEEGPWMTEPDREEWRHNGVPCLAVRGPMGAWCGYAATPPGHPWHGQSYDDITAEAHGGLTFSGPCQEGGNICHVPQEGEPADVFWFGFDCAHAGDAMPAVAFPGMPVFRMPMFGDSVYRDLAYVKAEVEALADQIVAAGR